LSIENAEFFCQSYQKLLDEFCFDEDNIINADETSIEIDYDSDRTKYIETRKKSKHSQLNVESRGHVACLPFVTASGKILLVVYILPMLKFDQEIPESFIKYSGYCTRNKHRVLLIMTEKGYMTDIAWREIMKIFIIEVEKRMDGKNTLLITDNLRHHIQSGVLVDLIKSKIYSLFLLENSTHFLQPLDVDVFGQFKQQLKKIWNSAISHNFGPTALVLAINSLQHWRLKHYHSIQIQLGADSKKLAYIHSIQKKLSNWLI
jgi:hypothetical protein